MVDVYTSAAAAAGATACAGAAVGSTRTYSSKYVLQRISAQVVSNTLRLWVARYVLGRVEWFVKLDWANGVIAAAEPRVATDSWVWFAHPGDVVACDMCTHAYVHVHTVLHTYTFAHSFTALTSMHVIAIVVNCGLEGVGGLLSACIRCDKAGSVHPGHCFDVRVYLFEVRVEALQLDD